MNFYVARLSPDGSWILLEGAPTGSSDLGLYRADLRGGTPHLLFFIDAPMFCVFGRPSTDKNELIVVAFDPLGGQGKELVRIPLEAGSSADIGLDYSWQLSSDGSRIGIVKRHDNQIRLVP
jgi:hypothetical protein